jgi:hypothetical protein
MPNISDVLIINTKETLDHRDTKYCVYVSALTGKFFYINTKHRDIYDDFEIKSSDYVFLNSVDRFVCCVKLHDIDSVILIDKIGNLNRDDMLKILNKIQKSNDIKNADKDSIVPELRKWLLGIP